MVKVTNQTRISYNGGTLITAFEDAKISPENFFGTKIPTIVELNKEIENEAWFLMHPIQIKDVGAQSWKLVHPIGSGGDTY